MSKLKRVLHFQGRMGRGGAESFMMNAFRKIDKDKYIFDFVIYEDYKDVQPYHKEIYELGGKIYIVTNPNKNIIKYIKDVKKIFTNNQVDIVHNQIFFGGGINLLLAKNAGINKRIAHSHATTDGKNDKLTYVIARPFLRKLLMDNATDYLACSYDAGIGLFGEDHDFTIVPNGIDIESYSEIIETKDDIRKSLEMNNNEFVIGHIGRFETQKNHKFLIKIFREVLNKKHNAKLLLIGKGSLEKEVKNLAENLGVDSNIIFLGERNDIPRLLKAMDVFVMPSLYEGLPMVAVEAQAANLKLVLSDEISKDTVLSKNVTFLSLDESFNKWSEVILRTPYDNSPLAKLQNFDYNHTAKILEGIYEDNRTIQGSNL